MIRVKYSSLVLAVIAILSCQIVSAKGIAYIGGMMVHCGYSSGGELSVPGTNQAIDVKGVSSGIGGRLLFSVNKHLRVGSEGYVSNVSYGDRRTASIGWGGLAADYGWQLGSFRPTFGVTVGVGGYKNICVVDTPLGNDIVQPAIWNDYTVAVVVPYVGVEYSLTQKIKVYSRVDCITAPATKHNDFATGPKLHLGFMFSH